VLFSLLCCYIVMKTYIYIYICIYTVTTVLLYLSYNLSFIYNCPTVSCIVIVFRTLSKEGEGLTLYKDFIRDYPTRTNTMSILWFVHSDSFRHLWRFARLETLLSLFIIRDLRLHFNPWNISPARQDNTYCREEKSIFDWIARPINSITHHVNKLINMFYFHKTKWLHGWHCITTY